LQKKDKQVFIKDKRRNLRFGCTGPADVLLAADTPLLPARIVNVSKGGCLIELQKSQSLDQGTSAELTFKVNRLPFRMRVRAAAIRSDTMIGFEFPVLSERVRGQLEELIEELAADWRKRFAAHRWHVGDFDTGG
jgi:hypothetical protein